MKTKPQSVYIEFLNKDKKFTVDRKYFEGIDFVDAYTNAKKWALENFEKFDPDFIKQDNY